MAIKSWYTLISPREDLRAGKPMDASQFAVHLDHVRAGTAPEDYVDAERFFKRTFLTENMLFLASQTLRRLNGIKVETSPVFNLSTQFGGGKTHALTILYHLATNGEKSKNYQGVDRIMKQAEVDDFPSTKVSVFVGTEFSSVTGRGAEGEPKRMTPWGELAWQVGGAAGYEVLRKLDETYIAPAGDNLNDLFDKDQSYLLLFDEVMNYISKHRNYNEMAGQFYDFLHTLTEFVRSRNNIVLAVSIPASELEMTVEDQADFDRLKKMLDRLGKAIFMSGKNEAREIIRRRLFDWEGLPAEARKSVGQHVQWLKDHDSQIPQWFNLDDARAEFEASYPFHPSVISVFERKWQSLPRFQQTRGILRLLALWVSHAYNEGYKKSTNDPLISLGTAPLENQHFRAAVFEQLGENRLETAVTTDIAGKTGAHSIRLDQEAIEAVKKGKLHRKCATTIFFESNGGQTSEGLTTIPEIKLSICDPDLDIGLVDNVLQSLLDTCYYLTSVNNKYKYSTQENLIKRYSDRRANIDEDDVDTVVTDEIRKVFSKKKDFETIFFPTKSNQITDRPVISFVVIHPEKQKDKESTLTLLNDFIRNYGNSARVFKSGIFFCVAENYQLLRNEAKKYLAWESIYDERNDLNLEFEQVKQVKTNMDRALRDLKEGTWGTYKTLYFLNKKNELYEKDLGLLHSSQAHSLLDLYLNQLLSEAEITDEINPNYLVRHWPPAFKTWSTKKVQEVFYASPKFPRLLYPESIKQTISKGVTNGFLAYVGKAGNKYDPFTFNETLNADDVEISEEMFIITAKEAKIHVEPRSLKTLEIIPADAFIEPSSSFTFSSKGYDQYGDEIETGELVWEISDGIVSDHGKVTAPDNEGVIKLTVNYDDVSSSTQITIKKKPIQPPGPGPVPEPTSKKSFRWSGKLDHSKWMIFYTKVLTKVVGQKDVKITVGFDVEDESLTDQKIEEVKGAIKEMGLDD